MMKIRTITYAVLISIAALMTSCGGDDDKAVVIPTVPPPGAGDGFFITGSATSAEALSVNALDDAAVDAFGAEQPWEDRSGLYEAYLWMAAGTFNVIEVKGEDETVWGGSVTEEDMGTGKLLVGEISDGGAAITVTEGFHHVIVDKTSATIYVAKIEHFGLIGPAGPGWSADENTLLPLKSADAATGTVIFEGTGIDLVQNEFKLRYNSNWNNDRSSATPAVEGLNFLTNFGTSVSGGDQTTGLQPGGYNFNFAGQAGRYTVTMTFTAKKGFGVAATYTRTGDSDPVTFDPAEYNWGVIGTATDSAWDADVNLTYKGEDAGTHRWVGFVFMKDGAFKYRINDAWDFSVGPGNVTHTGNAAGQIGGANDYELDNPADSGYYYISITTADEGATWQVNIDEGVWGIIGDATPGGWNASTALTYNGDNTWSSSVALTAAEYKFRANDSWDFNLGGDLNALVQDGGNFAATAGTFTVTVMTNDHGATYSATVQ